MEKEKMKELSQEELKDVSGGLALNQAPAKDGLYPIGLAEDKLAGGLAEDKLAGGLVTDKLVEILHGDHDSGPFEAHERELFESAVKTEFLDYFMTRNCRRVLTLRDCPVKPYGDLVDGRPMKHPGHPLPNDVYLTYI